MTLTQVKLKRFTAFSDLRVDLSPGINVFVGANGPNEQPWPRPIAKRCAVFNIETWNRHLPEYPIERRSESR